MIEEERERGFGSVEYVSKYAQAMRPMRGNQLLHDHTTFHERVRGTSVNENADVVEGERPSGPHREMQWPSIFRQPTQPPLPAWLFERPVPSARVVAVATRALSGLATALLVVAVAWEAWHWRQRRRLRAVPPTAAAPKTARATKRASAPAKGASATATRSTSTASPMGSSATDSAGPEGVCGASGASRTGWAMCTFR